MPQAFKSQKTGIHPGYGMAISGISWMKRGILWKKTEQSTYPFVFNIFIF
jgi:hypothetical protein